MSIHQLTTKFCSRLFYSQPLSKPLADEQGQGLIEYVLLVTIIAIAMISSLISVREVIHAVLTSIPFPPA